MSGKTAGQQAYEAFYDATPAGRGLSWDEIGDSLRGYWTAAAAAVETEQVRLAREDRDQLRKQVLDLAGELDGRCPTRPPGQSHTEHEIAIALRKLMEPVTACDKCGIPVTGGTRCDQCRQLLADLEGK
jgi:hypothetical protein